MKTLVLGSGRRTLKMVWLRDQTKEYEGEVITVDINPDLEPDLLWDLREHPLPFKNNEFDEIHAYHVLEHLAKQGDYEFFFKEFAEYYRILKEHGKFFAVVPDINSIWAWGDPGHTRLFPKSYLMFLNKDRYEDIGDNDALSDYRYLLKCNFITTWSNVEDGMLAFILEKNGAINGV